VISLQVGDCWLWSLIIFLIQRFISGVLEPHYLTGGVGGIYPTQISPRGSRGVGGFRGSTREAKYWEKLSCKILQFHSQSGPFVLRSQI
jgi:hypothetical protein